MECHRCPHREDIDNGKYAATPFPDTPCAKCELRECSLRTMAVDPDRPVYVPGREGEAEPTCKMVPFPEEADAIETKVAVGVMEEFITRLLGLPDEVRDVVCWRFIGLTYPQIAQRQGITTAGAERRHERAMRLFPELRELFKLKTARQEMRRVAESRAEQVPVGES